MEALPGQGVLSEKPENKHPDSLSSPSFSYWGSHWLNPTGSQTSLGPVTVSSVQRPGAQTRVEEGGDRPRRANGRIWGLASISLLLDEEPTSPAEGTCEVPPATLMQGDVNLLNIST